MQTAILNVAPDSNIGPGPESILTFRPFINHLKKRRDAASGHRSRFFSFIIDQFERYPQITEKPDINELKDHAELLQLIYNTLSAIIEDEDKNCWALSMPLHPSIFYSTNAFYNLIASIATGNIRKSIATKNPEEIKRNKKEFCYSVILEKCYNISSVFKREMVHLLEDEETGLVRYYRMNMDTSFIEVHTTAPLKEFKVELLHSQSNDHHDPLPLLEEFMPLDAFRFEGFGVIRITDITADYAIENIKNVLLNKSFFEVQEYYTNVINSLKVLVETNDIEFGLLPVLQVNNKLIFNDSTCLNSKLIRTAREHGIAEMAYMSMAESYFKNPRPLFFRAITPEDESRQIYVKILKMNGISAYALLPIFFNGKPVGVLEVYSHKKGILDENLLSKLDAAIPLLAQLLKNTIDEFNDGIDKVVKEKFTALQPSVEWKFNEAAWHFIRDSQQQNKDSEVEDINFEKVYPLYGAVDIRNSTVERNAALRRDMEMQFTVLHDVLAKLKEQYDIGLIDEKIFLADKWLERINSAGFNQEVKLNEFLENNITPFLLQFTESNPECTPILEEYFKVIDERTGAATESRRQLEKSMNTVITAVNKYMDLLKEEVQKAYPCYFEKFRTDGVEYDIYIGQAISPDRPFTDIYLKNLRLLQLKSMAEIAVYSYGIIPELSKAVETTQLIFIHSHPIDIKFRKDEKRFDVEGAYNIRYHIIKKRIDKVRIKGSQERLTQPQKIALVYFSQREAEEYINYIKYLQEQDVLLHDLEELELEELQGVSGLKALRVGVNVEYNKKKQTSSI